MFLSVQRNEPLKIVKDFGAGPRAICFLTSLCPPTSVDAEVLYMRRTDREVTDPKAIEEIIETAEYCTVSMCDDSQPYGVWMNYGYRDNCFYFHSAGSGHKLEVLRKNPRVCIQLACDTQVILSGAPDTWSMQYRSVVATGKAQFVDDPAAKQEGLDILLHHFAGRGFSFPNEVLENVTIIKVPLERISAKENLL